MEVTSKGIPVNTLVDSVKESLRSVDASRDPGVANLQIASVCLILNVLAIESADGRLDFYAPFIGMKLSTGAKLTTQDTYSVEITLAPLEPGWQLSGSRSDIEIILANAIQRVMVSTAESDESLALPTGEVEITFVITKEGSISIGIEGELLGEFTNKLRISLKPRAC